MRRYQNVLAWMGAVLLMAFAVDVVLERLVTRSVAFHSGSGQYRSQLKFAGYPLSERVTSSETTRLAGSEKWPGTWRTYSTSYGLFLYRAIGCSQYGQVPTVLEIAAHQLRQHEPDPIRRERIAQQLLRQAQTGTSDAIDAWLIQAHEAISAGGPLPELAESGAERGAE